MSVVEGQRSGRAPAAGRKAAPAASPASAFIGLTARRNPADLLARREAAIAAIVLLFVLQAALRLGSHIDHDPAWYLYAAGRMLDGARLYVDLVEVNPPLGIWLTLPVALLARWTGLPAPFLYQGSVFLLVGISVALSVFVMRGITEISAAARNLLLVAVTALLLFLPASDFGQREHLLIAFVTPWLLLRWTRLLAKPAPVALAVVAGVMAAVGFGLKPYCLLSAVAIEVAVLVLSRDIRITFRVENLAAIAFGAAYLLAMWLLTPEFYSRVIGLAMTAYVPFYGFGHGVIAGRSVLPLFLAVVVFEVARVIGKPLGQLGYLLLAGGLAALLMFLVQAGFRYQLLPALYLLTLGASLGLVGLVGGTRPAALRGQVAVGASVLAMAMVFAIAMPIQATPYLGTMFSRATAAAAPAARRIFIASTKVSHGFPLVEERNLVWSSRFPTQWLAPYVASTLGPDGRPGNAIGDYLLEATVSDLLHFEPEIVFVGEGEVQPYFKGAPLDYVAFWDHDPRFGAFWKQYSREVSVDGFAVYVRKGVNAGG